MKMTGRIILILMCFMQVAEARQFRSIAPIPVAPENSMVTAHSGLTVSLIPVEQELIEAAVKDIINTWNQQGFGDYLDELFANKSKLLSTMARDIPKDARLRLLSMKNTSTIAQQWGKKTRLNKRTRTSTVVSTVSLQIEFVDPFKGLVVIPHTSQFYLQVLESE